MQKLVNKCPLWVPSHDGQVLAYDAFQPPRDVPRIYYVNGIQTSAQQHAEIAQLLSVLCEHTVFGLYNASAGLGKKGLILDLAQCSADWLDIFLAKLAERGTAALNGMLNDSASWVRRKLGKPLGDPIDVADSIRRRIPEERRVQFIEWSVSQYNPATASLFRQLVAHRAQSQIIVAHSQGNLVACDALWSLAIAYGDAALHSIQILSLASPAPAWPMGMRGGRRKVYGNENDLVTLADPHNWDWLMERVFQGQYRRTAGDWRRHGDGKIGIAPHDVKLHLLEMHFADRLRSLVGLPPLSYENRAQLVNP